MPAALEAAETTQPGAPSPGANVMANGAINWTVGKVFWTLGVFLLAGLAGGWVGGWVYECGRCGWCCMMGSSRVLLIAGRVHMTTVSADVSQCRWSVTWILLTYGHSCRNWRWLAGLADHTQQQAMVLLLSR